MWYSVHQLNKHYLKERVGYDLHNHHPLKSNSLCRLSGHSTHHLFANDDACLSLPYPLPRIHVHSCMYPVSCTKVPVSTAQHSVTVILSVLYLFICHPFLQIPQLFHYFIRCSLLLSMQCLLFYSVHCNLLYAPKSYGE